MWSTSSTSEPTPVQEQEIILVEFYRGHLKMVIIFLLRIVMMVVWRSEYACASAATVRSSKSRFVISYMRFDIAHAPIL